VPIPTTPLERRSQLRRVAVFDTLLEAIVAGDLAPNDRIDDGAWAMQTGTSRGPVREALERLDELGLVVIVPRQMTRVASVDVSRLMQSIEVNGALGLEAVSTAAGRLTTADRRALAKYGEELRSADDQLMRELVRSLRIERDLLARVFARAENPELQRARSWVVPYIRWASRRYGGTIDPARERREQLALLEALVDGDVEAARAAWAAYRESLTQFIASPTLVDAARYDTHGPSSTKPLLRTSMVDDIRAAILDGTLLPGEPLAEQQLMVWLGASRTPVRAALSRLAQEGLIVLEPHRKPLVARIDAELVRQTLGTLAVLRGVGLTSALKSDADAVVSAVDRATEALGGEGSDQERFEILAGLADEVDRLGGNDVEIGVAQPFATRVRWFGARGALNPLDGVIGRIAAIREAIVAGADPVPDLRAAYLAVAPR